MQSSQPRNYSTTQITAVIRDEIERAGAISFARFMELALYHPQLGYYSSGRAAIGRRGDYFTSVSVGPLFGLLLAAQCAEVWEKLDRPNEFVIVEQGANDGAFARDVLHALQQHHRDCFAQVRYRIVEPFPILRARQEQTLAPLAGKLDWEESLENMASVCGVHFSNEFVDALPVHLIAAGGGRKQRVWRERCVSRNENDFCFVDGLPNDKNWHAQIARLPPAPEDRYETEVNLNALAWLETLAGKLKRGVILIADYGFNRADFYAPTRARGTLQSYAAHRALSSPFEKIGASDLTAHVEWTSLAERALDSGLTIAGFTDQHHFLTGLLSNDPALARRAAQSSRQLQTLLHPEFLGTRFQFLGLTTSCPSSLGGFAFACDARASLGMVA